MSSTTSADGTTISYDQAGDGPAIIFVAGAFNLRDTCAPLAGELAPDHTVITYDRRARGQSTDTRPYAVEREVEDLKALLEAAGGSASVFGYSSGAILALEAVSSGLEVDRLFLYEPPFRVGNGAPPLATDLPDRLQRLLEEGKPGEVVATFQTEGIGLPAEVVRNLRQSPMWPQLEAMAQSVVYDATICQAYQQPTEAMCAVAVPTLVLQGEQTWPLLRAAATQLADQLPQADLHVVAGTGHDLDATGTAAAIRRFELG